LIGDEESKTLIGEDFSQTWVQGHDMSFQCRRSEDIYSETPPIPSDQYRPDNATLTEAELAAKMMGICQIL